MLSITEYETRVEPINKLKFAKLHSPQFAQKVLAKLFQ